MNQQPRENVYLFSAIFILLISVFYLHGVTRAFEFPSFHIFDTEEQEIEQELQNKPRPIEPIIAAEAAVVYDTSTELPIFQKNSDTPLPLASLTKIMTAIVALDIASPDETVTISRQAVGQVGDNQLTVGDTWQVHDLVRFMLLTSSNDAAYALAEHAGGILANKAGGGSISPITRFVAHMNAYAAAYGFHSLSFNNPTGLDQQGRTENGGYGTATDIARLFLHGFETYPGVFTASSAAEHVFTTEHTEIRGENSNTDIKLGTVLASKTGYTNLSGGNLAIIYNKGLYDPHVVVVLGSTFTDRFSDVRSLVERVIVNE